MPACKDFHKIVMIGSGPVKPGQAGEFDYAASQACKALKNEGFQIVMLNSNPITLSTDFDLADKVYIEPLTLENLQKIIAIEKPEALLPVFGGQIAMNLAYFLARAGILEQNQMKILGISEAVIQNTEDRLKFRELLAELGIKLPAGAIATSLSEGMAIGQRIGFPAVIRASFAMEGAGVVMAYNQEELEEFLEMALSLSPIGQVLVEESLDGYREFEFEVFRDSFDRTRVITSLEKIDPVGVHSGNSAVVIPAQGLSPEEYIRLADISAQIIRKLAVIGSINIQFAVNQKSGAIYPIEVNPRFTKSSALAAKATGLQIPIIAAKLAVGFGLDELGVADDPKKPDEKECIRHIAIKLPRFSFEKFPSADPVLGTTLKAVGEVIAFGCDFKEAFQKALRSLMNDRYGLGADGRDLDESKLTIWELKDKISNPNEERWFFLRYALKRGILVGDLVNLSKLSPWFVQEMQQLVAFEKQLTTYALYNLTPEVLSQAKKWGFSDVQLAYLLRTSEDEVRATRLKKEIACHFLPLIVKGAQGESRSYFFSTYHAQEHSVEIKQGSKILFIGTGATRIGQGTEYDYSLTHAAKTVREKGYASVIINCNPSSITTDPVNNDVLYLDPLVKEDILNILDREKPEAVLLKFSGCASSVFAAPLQKAGIQILGAVGEIVQQSGEREYLKKNLLIPGLLFPESGTSGDKKEAMDLAGKIGYPVIVRFIDHPLEVCFNAEDLKSYLERIRDLNQNNPLRMEKFIDDAIGLMVHCVYDGENLLICGIAEQIEEAGIHPADCACAIPPSSLGEAMIAKIKFLTGSLMKALSIRGCFAIQYAVKHDTVYLLTINSQSDSMLPFISKTTGVDWAAAAVKILLGESIKDQGLREPVFHHTTIKEAVFSFDRFPGVDTLLGPSMRSSGAVMGIDNNFGMAFIKSQLAAGERMPESGTIFVSIRDEDKRAFISLARQLIDLGFAIMAPEETADLFERNNIRCQPVNRVGQGRPNIIDKIKNGEVHWIISIHSGRKTSPAEVQIRSTAVRRGIPITTTLSGTQVAVLGLQQYLKTKMNVKPFLEYYN